MSKSEDNEPILEVKSLRVNFHTYRGEVKALNSVDLKLYRHEVLAVVGESGCGKSVTALTIINLLPENAYVIDGEIIFNKENLLKKSREETRLMRANEFATVFQDPMTFLNPVLTIGSQLEETFMINEEALKKAVLARNQGKNINYSKFLAMKSQRESEPTKNRASNKEVKEMAKHLCLEVLRIVKLPDPERILKQYPFELSGGMRQRAMIAMALARRPAIFIADEVTTALDVTIQAQILHLMRELRDTIDASTLMITHDLSVAAEIADRVAVMYAGNVVEVAPTRDIFRKPFHPYTQLLMKSIPNIAKPVKELEFIPGTVPDLIDPPPGCRFHPRCPFAMNICPMTAPPIVKTGENHEASCYLYGG